MRESALVFAVVLATFYVGHQLADHVFGQSDRQAAYKADKGWLGWYHLLGHVMAYHLVVGVMLAVVVGLFDLPVAVPGVIAGLLFSAATHALLDRRWPVRWIDPCPHRFAGIRGPYIADLRHVPG